MGNTEKILVNGKEFTVFRVPPIPIARKIEKRLIELAEDFTGDLKDLESGNFKITDMKGLKMYLLYEVHDILLTEVVISPKITIDDINNWVHELQPCFADLIDILMEKHSDIKTKEKKKLTNSDNLGAHPPVGTG